MIGRLYELVIDCPDPRALAPFYEQLLGMRRHYDEPEWVTIGAGGGSTGLAFQRIDDYRPPRWPDPDHPQRLHVDVMVDNLDVAEAKVLALGATLLDGSDKPIGYRVYADPIGHPFCLLTPESVPTHA
jgi:catechol 2,3-dioxygenase-like lactoylglutathione lyase family enzyme